MLESGVLFWSTTPENPYQSKEASEFNHHYTIACNLTVISNDDSSRFSVARLKLLDVCCRLEFSGGDDITDEAVRSSRAFSVII